MPTTDETIGETVKFLRKAMGMSQARLAEAMREAGFAGFQFQTVAKIEQGARSVKLVEGLALAKILGVEPGSLYDLPTTARDDQEARRLTSELQATSTKIRDLYRRLVEVEIDLERAVAGGVLSPDVREIGRWTLDKDGAEATRAALGPATDLEERPEPTDEAYADMDTQAQIDETRAR